jgi:hypothetical protein
VDSSRARDELGIGFRPQRESLEDTIRWLVAAGHLDPSRVRPTVPADCLGDPPPPC